MRRLLLYVWYVLNSELKYCCFQPSNEQSHLEIKTCSNLASQKFSIYNWQWILNALINAATLSDIIAELTNANNSNSFARSNSSWKLLWIVNRINEAVAGANFDAIQLCSSFDRVNGTSQWQFAAIDSIADRNWSIDCGSITLMRGQLTVLTIEIDRLIVMLLP